MGLTGDGLADFVHRREAEAQRIAHAKGRAKSWTGYFYVAHEDRMLADFIVRSGLTLCPVGSR